MEKPIPDWLDVSRETAEKLEFFASEVLRWTPAINLISKASMTEIWHRHILDSAQIFTLKPDIDGPWVDIGSGGGFPAVVLAILGVPNMILVESDQRKAAFLREMARQMGLEYQVLAQRIEGIPAFQAKTMSARALGALTGLLGHANTHLAHGGKAIFLKGRSAEAEMREARKVWRFQSRSVSSKTDQEATILVIENIEQL